MGGTLSSYREVARACRRAAAYSTVLEVDVELEDVSGLIGSLFFFLGFQLVVCFYENHTYRYYCTHYT